MALNATFSKKTFHFNFRARTSRGSMTQKDSWFIKVFENNHSSSFGIGEAGPLPGLSLEWNEEFDSEVADLIESFNQRKLSLSDFSKDPCHNAEKLISSLPRLQQLPSLLFAFETAILDLFNGGRRLILENDFVNGVPIAINGLIWMGGMDQMLQQIEIKIQEGFNCLKLKVGGINFENECDILQYIRRKYFKMNIQLRLDANGALKPEEVMYKLHELSKFGIHSIEQPLKPGNDLTTELCRKSPIPIALDEELIGIQGLKARQELLHRIKPQFIILKPSLHGGLLGCQEWIKTANDLGIGWWITSALESNVGLNAIAQFVAGFGNSLHQGLGTGKIYEDNFNSPLTVDKGHLRYNRSAEWEISS